MGNKEPKPLVDKASRNWLIGIIIVIVAIIGMIVFFSSNAGGKFESFAKCLTDSGVKMYGAYWCPHCADQKAKFGNSWTYVNYIECSLPNKGGQNQKCNSIGIQSYPTWELADGQKVEEVLSLQQLSKLSGCPLSEN